MRTLKIHHIRALMGVAVKGRQPLQGAELLIRTGGELRISNYLLWQIAYSELYFTDTFWPDFDEEGLHEAIASYQARQRRFGKTGQQIDSDSAAKH